MTANQINFAKLGEDQRHNRVSEQQKQLEIAQKDRDLAIGERNATVAEMNAQTQRNTQVEQARHNVTSEGIQRDLGIQTIAETTRHNTVSEQQNQLQIEQLGDYYAGQVSAAKAQAAASQQQAKVAGLAQQETVRHNKLAESISSLEVANDTKRAESTVQTAGQKVVENKIAQERLQLDQELQPYKKWDYGTKAAQQASNAARTATSTITSLAKSILGG